MYSNKLVIRNGMIIATYQQYVSSNTWRAVRMAHTILGPKIWYGASNNISKDTRRTARPALSANISLPVSSLQNSHTL